MFVADQSTFATNAINIILDNTLMISVGLDTNISSVCNMYLAAYPSLMTEITMTNIIATTTNPNYVAKQATFGADNSGKWFYTRCGYDLDYKNFYTMLTVEDVASPIVQSNTNIPNHSYYDSQALDFNFQYYWNTSMTLSINNAKAVTKAVYLRNIQLFSEFIPSSSRVNYL